jgi:proline dehydrogenase
VDGALDGFVEVRGKWQIRQSTVASETLNMAAPQGKVTVLDPYGFVDGCQRWFQLQEDTTLIALRLDMALRSLDTSLLPSAYFRAYLLCDRQPPSDGNGSYEHMSILRNALLWGSQNKWLERQFRQRRFAKRAISRFMPGEDVTSALDAAENLGESNIASILTRLGENVNSMAEVGEVVAHYMRVLDKVRERQIDTHISVKLTQLGLDIDKRASFVNLERLIERAGELDTFFWIDMEASEYVDITLEQYHEARQRFPNVGVCVQAYLYRTKDDLTKLLDAGSCIRLVKGAYNEPPSLAFPRKQDVDENYFALARQVLEHTVSANGHSGAGGPHAMATHDLRLIDRIRGAATQLNAQRTAFEVSMLYGIRAQEQQSLAAAAVPTRVLISYGESWFPWYMRRLAERPANVGFVIRSMMWR